MADAFTLLSRGGSLGSFRKEEVSREEVLNMMAGGAELESLDAELAEFQREDKAKKANLASQSTHLDEETSAGQPSPRIVGGY